MDIQKSFAVVDTVKTRTLIGAKAQLRTDAIASPIRQILTGGETGRRNMKLGTRLENWSSQSNLGVAFDSSTGFRLPNGAIRSPDAAWVRLDRWQALTPEQRKKFVPLCPDFLVELRSLSDELEDIQAKMQEYLTNGLLLGWLIDPQRQTVEIYRPNQAVETLN